VKENRGNIQADQELVGKVLDGDTNAFVTVIQNTEGLVTQIIFKMISNTEDRKDIAQDIYLKAYKSLPGFRHQSKLSTWIAQIAYNTCFTYLEKKKLVFPGSWSGNNDENDDQPELADQKLIGNLFSQIENDIFQRELNEILKTEIELLSPLHKTLITLYHNEELSYEEISRITELPEGTVKSYLFRARRSLKDNLLRKYKKEEL
jgi:RNA polymerase sigma-70 factor (ECF subfamily)